jgi:hypothetical protein
MIDFFSRMNKPGSTLSAGIAAAGEALPGITARRKDLMAEELAATKGMSDLTLAERAEMLGITKEALALRENELNREQKLEAARIGATPRDTDLDKTTKAIFDDLVTNQKMDPKNPATKALARKTAIEQTGLALRKVETQEDAQLTNRLKNDPQMKTLRAQLYMVEEKDKPEIEAKIQRREAEIRGDIKGPSAVPAPDKTDGSGRFPAGTMNNPLAMPSKQEDLQKNKVYQTKRGPATWNGTEFVQK